MKDYPTGFTRILLATLTLLFTSGLALVPNALDTRLGLELGLWSLGHQRTWVAALHAISFFTTLMLLGALWTVHMRAGWIRRENIFSGILLLVAFGLLVASGLMLYYAGNELAGQIALSIHLLAGFLLPILLFAHLIGALQARRRCGLRQPSTIGEG
ncbi:MAG: hypothetical protein P3W87_003170, partial [Gammaproteobacteria bacterium]|nr:hypothetical protein [Gammaproteobacteria bacterium]